MTLSTTQKNYIATHFGRSNCYASSGVSYTDPSGRSQTGSTQDVVTTLQMGIGSAARGPGGETYMSIPGFSSISDSDLRSLGSESYCVGGSTPAPPPPVTGGCTLGTRRCSGNRVEVCMSNPGYDNRWVDLGECEFGCYGGVCRSDPSPTPTPPPTGTECTLGTRRCNGRVVEECVSVSGGDNRWDKLHTCEFGCTGAGICTTQSAPAASGGQAGTGPFEVTIGGQTGTSCPSGDPNATLDVSGAYAYYKSSPASYVGVMGIEVTHHNNDDCYAYFAWEMRMWDGHGYVSCPAMTPEVTEISRFLATAGATKDMTLQKVLANGTEMIGGSFEVPASETGKKTVCLTLWGNYSYPALVQELADAGYAQSIPW